MSRRCRRGRAAEPNESSRTGPMHDPRRLDRTRRETRAGPPQRERVLGAPEISSDGFKPYLPAIRTEFANSAHGVIEKTFSVTHLNMHQSQHRYSPAAVVAVEREAVYGVPAQISTSYVERSHLTLR